MKKRIPFTNLIIYILIIIVPIHNMVFDIIIKGSADNIIRDCLIIVLLLVVIFKNNFKLKLGKLGLLIIFSWIIIIIYTVISNRFLISLNLARIYLLPTLIYLVIINNTSDNAQLEKFEKFFIYTAVILAIWGFLQAFILGDSFLIKIGYPEEKGYLSSSFYIGGFLGKQRVTSTFASPNTCGAYLGIAIILLARNLNKYNKIYFGILIIALITTFSRSAIIGTIIALAYQNKNILFKRLNIVKIFLICLIAIIALKVIDSCFFEDIIFKMIGRTINTTIGGTDLSLQKHLSDLLEPLNIIFNNPFGLGFGNNGPIVLSQYSEANIVESSIYLLCYDFGIFGMIIYILPYILSICIFSKMYDYKMRCSGAISILILFTYLLLPIVQTYEIIFFVYLFFGVLEKQCLDKKNVSISEKL